MVRETQNLLYGAGSSEIADDNGNVTKVVDFNKPQGVGLYNSLNPNFSNEVDAAFDSAAKGTKPKAVVIPDPINNRTIYAFIHDHGNDTYSLTTISDAESKEQATKNFSDFNVEDVDPRRLSTRAGIDRELKQMHAFGQGIDFIPVQQ